MSERTPHSRDPAGVSVLRGAVRDSEGMDDVISLSSDESGDAEIISHREFIKSDPLPLSEVRVDIEALNRNVPRHFIDLTDPRWTFPNLKLHRRLDFISPPVIDLTESEEEKQLQAKNLQPNNRSQLERGNSNLNTVSINPNFDLLKSSVRGLKRSNSQPDCREQKQKYSPAQRQREILKANPCHNTTAAGQPFLDSHASELKTSGCFVQLTKDSSSISLHHLNNKSEAHKNISNLKTTILEVSHTGPEAIKAPAGHPVNAEELSRQQLQDKVLQHLPCPTDCAATEENPSDPTVNEHNTSENKQGVFLSPNLNPSSTFPPSPQSEASKETLVPKVERMELKRSESHQPDQPFLSSSSSALNPCDRVEFDSFSHTSRTSGHMSQGDPYEQMPDENTPEWWMEMDSYRDELGGESPVSLVWQGESDEEDKDEGHRFGSDFRAVSKEDRHFVCPVAFDKIMSGPAEILIDENYESMGPPEVLCRQSLSLVYSTIDENYSEGTLQLLSDLLQPGYYPPKDITSHLLRGILLEPQSPYHLRVEAFNLLMRTQRHHRANKSTISWDWELLTSVMSSQNHKGTHQHEVVRMFLEYVVQTLEDDFKVKSYSSVLHHSIAKATLSCDRQFPRVKDVIRWLFSAIIKSTELAGSSETIRERDEQIRIVSLFQRMLSLALEVDRSPALNSAKLSQELFHMVISHMPQRAHRMLLLENLQSKLLRCKLLEQLLDYACPQKIPQPMSLSLLLHFLKNCSLTTDSTDGAERWRRWEELIHLLWMLLLSYYKAMKVCLSSNSTEPRDKPGSLVYKPDDMVTKLAVQDAVDSFLSRSRADLGQDLPLHVEESLTYLQDHLLDVCQH
uniref:SUMO-interacting motifs containing 1 n=1 Tax=Iconisemion striatum TaxID=60296 RepID=A0A1A7YLI9_9TELE